MTNKELADKLSGAYLKLTVGDLENIEEAARRLRSLPDPTPEPEPPLTLRGLVEKHGCLRSRVQWDEKPVTIDDGVGHVTNYQWEIIDGPTAKSCATDTVALLIVRGIVKGLCDGKGAGWNANSSQPEKGEWYHFSKGKRHYHATELEAIDALLTEWEASK